MIGDVSARTKHDRIGWEVPTALPAIADGSIGNHDGTVVSVYY